LVISDDQLKQLADRFHATLEELQRELGPRT